MNTILNTAQLTCHPYCLAIPEMTEAEYQDLKGDIAGSGQLEPIVMFAGQILDGRHRYRACIELGIEPWLKDYDGPDSVMDYVISANLRRRHLSDGQKGMAMTNLCNLARGSNQHKPVVVEDVAVTVPDADDFALEAPKKEVRSIEQSSLTVEQAAEKIGIPVATMRRSIEVDRKGSPELMSDSHRHQVAPSAERGYDNCRIHHQSDSHRHQVAPSARTSPICLCWQVALFCWFVR